MKTRVVHPGYVPGGEPAAVQRVGRENLAFDDASGMDSGAADLQLAGPGAVLAGYAVFSGAQGGTDGTVQAAAQAQGRFKAVDGGLGHAETVDGVITQGVQRAEGLRGRMASAQDHHVHFGAEHL